MPKKCIICAAEAIYAIKDSSESYCQECAEEQFSELDVLEKIS